MLVKSVNDGVDIRKVTIATVYENGNQSSHLNPLVDSLRVYFVFARYLMSSLMTALVDLILFSIVYATTYSVPIGTARW